MAGSVRLFQAKRLEDAYKLSWPAPPEEIGQAELNALKVVWEPLLSAELANAIFPITANNNKFGKTQLL
jgi:hypothetical protein